MKKITIEVKDDYLENILTLLKSLQGIMIEKVTLFSKNQEEKNFYKLQESSMQKTWDNDEDKAWDAL